MLHNYQSYADKNLCISLIEFIKVPDGEIQHQNAGLKHKKFLLAEGTRREYAAWGLNTFLKSGYVCFILKFESITFLLIVQME